jgi:hypothetical protein
LYLPVDLRVYVKNLIMARIYTLFVLLTLSFSGFAQLSVTVENDTVCANESVWFKASGMTLYAWSDTVNLDNYLADSVNFSAATPGTYNITVLGYTPFPVDTDTFSFSVEVLSLPSVNITSSAGGAVCDGSSTELVASAGFASYAWTPASSLDNDTSNTVLATPTGNTTYVVMVTDDFGCSGMDSVAIQVTAGPSVTVTSTTDATGGYLCAGNSATLTATGSGISTYEWSPSATLNDTSSMTVVATPSASTTYTVVVTDTNGCTASESVEITVNSVLPTLTLNPEKDSICFGTSTAINSQSNGSTFAWTPSSTVDNPSAKDVIVSPTSTTTYTVVATRLGCTKSASVTIVVLPAPAMSYTQSSGGATICLDETDEITVDCPACVSYVWKFPNSSLNSTNNVQVVSPNEPGAILIKIKGIDASGCASNESVTVNVDSCFVGDPFIPFAVKELSAADVKVLTLQGRVELVAPGTIESVKLFNLLGEEVATMQGNKSSVSLQTESFASGVYIARIQTNGQELVKKIYLN